MARKILFIGLVGIILCATFVFGPGNLAGPVQAYDNHIDEATKQHILDATVKITLFAPLLDEAGNQKIFEENGKMRGQITVSEGLGTLVRAGGETLIITHDHWSMLTVKLDKVQFHNASNELLLELDWSTLFSLYRYRDGGTLVFVAPDKLSAQMSAVDLAGENVALQKDDALQVVYWQPESKELLIDERVSVERVTVEPVVVEATEQYKDLPTIKMQSVNGKVVINGNSGGGVFLNGQLVGNMWETIVRRTLVDGEETGVAMHTLSRAAQLTYQMLD